MTRDIGCETFVLCGGLWVNTTEIRSVMIGDRSAQVWVMFQETPLIVTGEGFEQLRELFEGDFH